MLSLKFRIINELICLISGIFFITAKSDILKDLYLFFFICFYSIYLLDKILGIYKSKKGGA